MSPAESQAQRQVIDCERTFRRYGLPLLIEDHSSRRDVFGRTAPLLLVLLLVGIVASVNDDWAWWQNLLAIVGAALVIAGSYAVLNVARRRPWSQLPLDVGVPELSFFVLAPAVPPLLAGWQWGDALVSVVGNLLTLGILWLIVRYGIHATFWWGLRGGIGELGASLLRLIRFLPLLLIFSIALFFNTEVWQVFDHTPGVSDYILGAFFALLIMAILRIRLTTETRQILAAAQQHTARADGAADVAAHDQTEDVETAPGETEVPAPPLTSRQLSNVRVMVAMNQLLQVVTVSAAVGLFFFALGTLTITPGVMEAWGIEGGSWDEMLVLGDARLQVSQTLLRVSVALATFTGLYYAISVLTDSLYRDDFIDDMAAKLRVVEHARRRYAVARARLQEQARPT